MSQVPQEEPTFEQSLLELAGLVKELEEGRLGLDEALERYEQGIGLIKRCHGKLRQAEQRILLLTGSDENDTPILQAFKHESTARRSLRGPDPLPE